MIEGARRSSRGTAATVLGLVTVFFASSAVVSELRDAMNTIWQIPEDTTSSAVRSIFNLVKDRLLCFALVLASGSFLIVSLIVDSWIFAAGKYLNSGVAPSEALIQATDWVVSFAVLTMLFALIFKALPRAALKWSDVTLGAVATSVLFAAGKFLLGMYLGKAGFATTYASGRIAHPRTGMGVLWRRCFFWAPSSREPTPAASAQGPRQRRVRRRRSGRITLCRNYRS